VSDIPLPTQDAADAHIARALSLFMGDQRKHSVSEVSLATGIKSRTLWSWIAANPIDRSTIPGDKLLVLMGFLGTEFTSKVLSIIGQGAHSLQAEHGQPAVVIAKLVTGVAEFAQRGSDNRFCHVDESALEPVADDMIEILTPFSTKGR